MKDLETANTAYFQAKLSETTLGAIEDQAKKVAAKLRTDATLTNFNVATSNLTLLAQIFKSRSYRDELLNDGPGNPMRIAFLQ